MARKNNNLVGQGFHTNPERINRKGSKKLPELNICLDEALTREDIIAHLTKVNQLCKKGNMKAIEWLFDRIYGKANQSLRFTDKDGNDIKPITFVLDDRYQNNAGISAQRLGLPERSTDHLQ